MVRNRQRKTDKAKWTANNMELAISAVKNGRSMREVSRSFSIPLTSLHDRIKNGKTVGPNMGRRTTFTTQQERDIANHCVLLSNLFYGMTPIELRRRAFEYAEASKIKHDFNVDSRLAGKDWLRGFLKRNTNVSVRQPEATSFNRVTGFSRVEVETFFQNLEKQFDKHKFPAGRVWNVDESGITNVHKPSAIIASRGQKQVGSVTSGERGTTVTVCCAVSATGTYAPPMFIYPRERMKPELEKGGPPGSLYRCSKSGWMTEFLFLEWLKHFAAFTSASPENPILLVLDNHSSHISLAIYNFCRQCGIVMVSLPPHTSQKLQPLDRTFFGPLKNEFNLQCELFLKNRNQKIIVTDIPEIFRKAYGKVANVEKAISGFESTGIYPYNPSIFNDSDFEPARIRQRIEDLSETEADNCHEQDTRRDITSRPIILGHPVSSATTSHPLSGSSISGPLRTSDSPLSDILNPSSSRLACSSHAEVSFCEISPVPGPLQARRSRAGRKKQHSEILTSSPMKERLEKKEENKKKKQLVGQKLKIGVQKEAKKTKQTTKITNPKSDKKKRKLNFSSSDEEEDISTKTLCHDISSDENLEEFDTVNLKQNGEDICSVCGEFGKERELWYKCSICPNWTHADCSGWERKGKAYTCDQCP